MRGSFIGRAQSIIISQVSLNFTWLWRASGRLTRFSAIMRSKNEINEKKMKGACRG